MFKITVTEKGALPARADARVFARRIADTVATECSVALIHGYVPATGEPRNPTAAGDPNGYDTGKLARGIVAQEATGSEDAAECRVTIPPDRERFVMREGNVLATDGLVGAVIATELDTLTQGLLR